MRKNWLHIFVPAALILLCALPAAAQQGAAEVRGQVVDAEGNPLEGVKITFVNPAKPDRVYEGSTNKKGRYYIRGLLYYEAQKDWTATVELEGFVVGSIDVTSRNQQRIVDKFESRIGSEQALPAIRIPGFGEVILDAVMVPEQEVASVDEVPATLPEAVAVTEGGPVSGQKPLEAANARFAAGDLEGAVPLYEKAIEAEPDNAEAHRRLAQVLYKLDRMGPAARQAMKATELEPESLDAQMVLYSVYVASDNLAGAQAALDRASEIAPGDKQVLDQGAYLAERSGDPDRAIEAYRAIVEAYPGDVNAWTALGSLYAQTGDDKRSEEAYQKVVELKPDDAYQVFYNIGALIMNRGNPDEADSRKAVDAFRKAIEIKPDYAKAHQQLAFALLGTGDLGGAAKSFERYLELEPDAEDAGTVRALLDGLKSR